jgi:CHAT domain-containing protein
MKEGNTMKYSYAHPLFWAPFVVVGDWFNIYLITFN